MTYFNNKKNPKDNGLAYCLQSCGEVTIILGTGFTMAFFPLRFDFVIILIMCSHVSAVEACAHAGRGQIPAIVMQGL